MTDQKTVPSKMIPLRKRLKLTKIEFFITHLSIVNVFLPIKMTPKEIEVLANFMSLTGLESLQRFGTYARKKVRKDMNLKPGGLGNYLKDLRIKGFITPDPLHKYTILPILFPTSWEQDYQFRLEMEKPEDE